MNDASRCEHSIYKDDRHEFYEMRGAGGGAVSNLTVKVCVKCCVVAVSWNEHATIFVEPPKNSLDEIAQRHKEGKWQK